MARVQTHIDADPEAIWAILRDGYRYPEWVVGTKAIRDVDPGFPAVDTSLHYTAGIGPLTHDGHTKVLSYVPGQKLELEAHAWPLGSARVEIGVAADGSGSSVDLDEHPLRGPGLMLHNPLTDLFLRLRGEEMLRRLKRLTQPR